MRERGKKGQRGGLIERERQIEDDREGDRRKQVERDGEEQRELDTWLMPDFTHLFHLPRFPLPFLPLMSCDRLWDRCKHTLHHPSLEP